MTQTLLYEETFWTKEISSIAFKSKRIQQSHDGMMASDVFYSFCLYSVNLLNGLGVGLFR